MTNGFYQGHDMDSGTLAMICLGEVSVKNGTDAEGKPIQYIDGDLQNTVLKDSGDGRVGFMFGKIHVL